MGWRVRGGTNYLGHSGGTSDIRWGWSWRLVVRLERFEISEAHAPGRNVKADPDLLRQPPPHLPDGLAPLYCLPHIADGLHGP